MKWIARIPLFLFSVPVMLFARNLDVVFIGVTQGSSPAFEETLDRRVRDNLSTFQEIALTDYLQTQSFRRKVRFDEFPTVSRKLIESLKQYSSDSAVFAWGRIKNCTFAGKRKNAIRGFIHGEIVLTLNIYSLRYKNYAFAGDVRAIADKNKGFVFFGDAEKEILVSTPDRNELTDRLLDQAARKSAALIATVIQSERLHAAKESAASDAKSYEVPSVSDMFNMPSVEGASVNKNRKRAFPAAEPLPPPKQTLPPVTDTLASKKQTPSPAAVKPDSVPTPKKPGPSIDTVKTPVKK